MGIKQTGRRLTAAVLFVGRVLVYIFLLAIGLQWLFSTGDSPAGGIAGRGRRPPTVTKHLVVASNSKLLPQTLWLSDVPGDWTVLHYVADAPLSENLSVPVVKGNEAMVYLTYIIDHYDNLPDVVFFRSGQRTAWHQERDSLAEVTSLQAGWVVEKGFVSARCLNGCENIIDIVPAEKRVEFEMFPYVGRETHLATLLWQFMEGRHEENEKREEAEDEQASQKVLRAKEKTPVKIAAPCCSQFAASRNAIRRRSKAFWEDLRQWLIDVPLPSRESGRLIEYTWHIWLGEEPIQ